MIRISSIIKNRHRSTFLLTLLVISAVTTAVSCATRSESTQEEAPRSFTSPIPTSPLPNPTAPLPTSGFVIPSPLSARTYIIVSPFSTPTPHAPATAVIPVYTYKVVNTYPHDINASTQGLMIEDRWLYEGTGRRGQSSLRRSELETGNVVQLYELPSQFFGEGVTIYGNQVIQLTWQSSVGFVYDKDSFQLLQVFYYPTEGWGITHDGERLIMSDGTATLHFLDPITFDEIGQVQVRDNDGPVARLNELEYIQGQVYANVWPTDRIARIDPQTGQVTGWLDLTGLLNAEDYDNSIGVLNGIAYDAENDRLFVTGKLWPKLFEIEIVDADEEG